MTQREQTVIGNHGGTTVISILVFILIVVRLIEFDHFDVVEAFGFQKIDQPIDALFGPIDQNGPCHIAARIFAALTNEPVKLAFLGRNP
jgi:hypothetical protein